jgi:hypothetical protein
MGAEAKNMGAEANARTVLAEVRHERVNFCDF